MIFEKLFKLRKPFLVSEIKSCIYSECGGMTGGREYISLVADADGTVLTTEQQAHHNSDEITQVLLLPKEALQRLTDLCNNHRIYRWGKLRKSKLFMLDAPTQKITIVTENTTISFGSGDILPKKHKTAMWDIYNLLCSFSEQYSEQTKST